MYMCFIELKETVGAGFATEGNLFEIISGEEVIMRKFVNYCGNWGLRTEKRKEGILYFMFGEGEASGKV
jgi:hypothetical protein